MPETTDRTPEPWEQRLLEACTAMLAALSDEECRELFVLRSLEWDGPIGLVMTPLGEDYMEVLWLGRRLGAVDRHWVMTGEVAA